MRPFRIQNEGFCGLSTASHATSTVWEYLGPGSVAYARGSFAGSVDSCILRS